VSVAGAVAAAAPTQTQIFDACVDMGCDIYEGRMHNLVCDNCHSHVARCMNEMRYDGSTGWNMVNLAAWVFFRGKWVSTGRALAAMLPFALIVVVVLGLRYGVGSGGGGRGR
jgi:hypothetical protein